MYSSFSSNIPHLKALIFQKNTVYLLVTVGILFFIASFFVEDLFRTLGALPFFFFKLDTGSGGSAGGCASGDCSAGCACAACSRDGDSYGPSTPFLMTWDGNEYHTENDLVLKFAPSYREALLKYEMSLEDTPGDLYRINNTIEERNNTIKLRIKEIEPEESFIDRLTIQKISYPETYAHVVDCELKKSTFFKRSAFEKNKIENTTGVLEPKAGVHNSTVSLKQSLNLESIKTFLSLDTWDTFTTEFDTTKYKNPHIVIASRLRDWTPGDAPKDQRSAGVENSSTELSFWQRSSRVVVSACAIVLGLFIGNSAKDTDADGLKVLSQTFGTKTAHASHPTCSFVLQYWTGTLYQDFAIVSPRDHQVNFDTSSIPKEAISANGTVKLRVVATKKHELGAFFVADAETEEEVNPKVQTFTLTRAVLSRDNNDYTAVLSSGRNGQFVHLQPLDTLDLMFESPVSDQGEAKLQQTKSDFLVSTDGFYIPLREETKVSLGDRWVDKLEKNDKERLLALYPISSYYKKDRKPVL